MDIGEKKRPEDKPSWRDGNGFYVINKEQEYYYYYYR